jgi:hypothetical protein
VLKLVAFPWPFGMQGLSLKDLIRLNDYEIGPHWDGENTFASSEETICLGSINVCEAMWGLLSPPL